MQNNSVSVEKYMDAKIEAVNVHFEARINNLEKHWIDMVAQRDIARSLAVQELERRLDELNHAHARADEALKTYLPRDIWDKFREEDIVWKRQSEVLRSNWVTQPEFQTYKETTQQALTLTAGKRAGISALWAAVSIAFSIIAAIGTASLAIFNILVRH